MSEERKKRLVWKGEIECAHCHEGNTVKIEKEIVVPAEPADFNIVVSVEKTRQTKLG